MGSHSYTMVSALAFIVVGILGVGGAPPPCCTSKMVGGVEYILRREEDTTIYDCLDKCIFEKKDSPGPLFCFAAGDLEVVCDDAEGGSGSGPPSEGGNEGGSGGGSPSEEGSGGDSPSEGGSGGGPPSGGGSGGDSPSEGGSGGGSSTEGENEGGSGGGSPSEGGSGGGSPSEGGSGSGPPSEGGNEGGSGGGSPSEGGSGDDSPSEGGNGSGTPSEGGNEAGSGSGSPSEGGGGSGSGAPVGENEGGKCTYPEGHTMIKYPGPVAECGYDLTITGLDQATKDELLKTHNEKRQKVASGSEAGQPGASNMRKFTWNDELAEIAQRWAGQCSFGHDETRNLCDGTLVGQNAYQGEADYGQYDYELNPAIGDAVNAWYNEVTNPGFASSNINPFVFGDGWGHYTAVAWAETEQVGCGRVYFEDNDQW